MGFDNQEKEKRKQQRLNAVRNMRDKRELLREEQFSLRVGYGDVVVVPKKKTSPKWNPAQAARDQRSLLQKNKKRKYDSSSKNKHTMTIHLPNLLKDVSYPNYIY